ncbi:MAG: hypothetical protein QM754_21250 [Tepidisphaeraceae bacterium]
MKHALLAAIAVMTLTGVSLAQNNNGSTSRQSFDKEYSDVVQRNPFLRERHAPRPPGDNGGRRRPTSDTPTRNQSNFTLRGVAIEDDELHAYFEPRRGGEMRRLAPGDTFENGRIVGIAIDAVAYEFQGQTIWIEIGQDLSGAKSSAVASSSGSSDATPPSDGSTQPAAKPTDNSLPAEGGSLAERMRARARAQRGNR